MASRRIQIIVSIDGNRSLYLYEDDVKQIVENHITAGLKFQNKVFKKVETEINIPAKTADELIKE